MKAFLPQWFDSVAEEVTKGPSCGDEVLSGDFLSNIDSSF